MAKFLYSAAMSLDGFISGPGGDISWMVGYLGPNPVVDQLIPRTGAILAGNRTFGGDDPYTGRPGEGEVFGGGWDGPQFVLTHLPPAEQVPGVTFVGDVETAIAQSRAAAGDNYVNILGASVPRSVSRQAYWTKCWCLSCRCYSATAPACSSNPAAGPRDWN